MNLISGHKNLSHYQEIGLTAPKPAANSLLTSINTAKEILAQSCSLVREYDRWQGQRKHVIGFAVTTLIFVVALAAIAAFSTSIVVSNLLFGIMLAAPVCLLVWSITSDILGARAIMSAHKLNRSATHFLLDKSVEARKDINPKKHLESAWCSIELTPALIEAAEHTKANLSVKSSQYKILANFEQSLKNAVLLSTKGLMSKRLNDVNKFIGLVENLESGQALSIPIESERHAMWLSVEKAEESGYKVTLFNTGNGCQYHHKRGDESSQFLDYQTFLSYRLNQACDLKALITTITSEACREMPSKDFYSLFLCELNAMQATLEPAPEEEEYYERRQTNGTCTAQCQMAFFRYFVMEHTEGTVTHKLGTYKILKSRMLKQIGESRVEHMDPAFKEALEQKLKKHELEIKLYELAGQEDVFCSPGPHHGTQEERYCLLRKWVKTMSASEIETAKTWPHLATLVEAAEYRENHLKREWGFIEGRFAQLHQENNPDGIKELQHTLYGHFPHFRTPKLWSWTPSNA